MVEFKEKRVDEEWKKRAEAEKEALSQKMHVDHEKQERARMLPKATFTNFMSGLAAQVMIALGQTEHPMTGQREVDVDQAQYTIDILKMIQEKTKGNLTKQEESQLESLAYQLQMAFVHVTNAGGEKAKGGRKQKPSG